jgi:hypothetical protein
MAPAPEAIVLGVRQAGNNQPTFDEYAIPRAKRKRLTEEQIAALKGTYLATRYRVWQIWLDALQEARPLDGGPLPCPEPKVADRIRDEEAVEWIVEDVEIKLFGNVRNLMCKRKIT